MNGAIKGVMKRRGWSGVWWRRGRLYIGVYAVAVLCCVVTTGTHSAVVSELGTTEGLHGRHVSQVASVPSGCQTWSAADVTRLRPWTEYIVFPIDKQTTCQHWLCRDGALMPAPVGMGQGALAGRGMWVWSNIFYLIMLLKVHTDTGKPIVNNHSFL